MITRDVNQLYVVPAFQHNAKFIACGATNLGTCTCAGGVTGAGSTWFPGFIIDRLGIQRLYNSVIIAPNVYAEVNVSDGPAALQHYAIGVGLQHASSSGATFVDYSTQEWLIDQGLWRQTTATATSTGAGAASTIYTAVQRDAADVLGGVMTTTTSTASGTTASVGSTSTGYAYYAGPAAAFDLGGAKRYIRVLIRPVINSTACGSGGMAVSATAVFGEPGAANWGASGATLPTGSVAAGGGDVTPVKRILVTTGCAT